ncbi:MAG: TIGR02996 domain-containing protein [Myxococcales bacterium]|nr:TIGR02996 domain-containing protein [Myxococcales bacterium]MCB9692324.1 TIGR02996 domain-containing protein [Alphaproteobacteria bacterium]
MNVPGWTPDAWGALAAPHVTDALRPLLEASVGVDLRNARLQRWYATSAPLVGTAASDLPGFLESVLPALSWRPRPGYYGPYAIARNISDTNLASLAAVVVASAHLADRAPFAALASIAARSFEKLPHSGAPAPDLGRCTAYALGRLGIPGGKALLGVRSGLRDVRPRKAVDAALAQVQQDTGLDAAGLAKAPSLDVSGPRSTREELLRAIYDAPADDGPRAVLADLLIEEGDPLGVFIQSQLRGDTRRAKSLLAKHRKEWLAPFAGDVALASVVFARGFPIEVKLSHTRFVKPGPHWSTVEVVDVGRSRGLGSFPKMVEDGYFPALRRALGVDHMMFMSGGTGIPEIALVRVNPGPKWTFSPLYIHRTTALRWLDITDFPPIRAAVLEDVQVAEVHVFSPLPETLVEAAPHIERLQMETERRPANGRVPIGWYVVRAEGRLEARLGKEPPGYDVAGVRARLEEHLPGLTFP